MKPDAGKPESKPESKPNAKDELKSLPLPEVELDVPSRASESGRTGRFSNPHSNPQSAMSCTTSAMFGSPRVLVSCCKTSPRSAVTAKA